MLAADLQLLGYSKRKAGKLVFAEMPPTTYEQNVRLLYRNHGQRINAALAKRTVDKAKKNIAKAVQNVKGQKPAFDFPLPS